ncbi:N-acetyltransferase [Virgisporangium aliadipatigenens]|nr:N-acetyltransferase [Virgisporangium aliadipatigenens]
MFPLAERPDLAPLLGTFHGGWPEFMYGDRVAPLYYDIAQTAFAQYVLVAPDPDEPTRAAAAAYSVPYTPPPVLPVGGWDAVVVAAISDRAAGRRGTQVSALEIMVQPDLRGRGLAAVVLDAMRRNAARLGHDTLVAPVRPNGKSDPFEPMSTYAFRTREDGLPVDPWLRVHVRAGARIEAVAPRSMLIAGTLAEWREWTGLPFDRPGPVRVPRALAPVHCDPDQDSAVYVEPNVWVRHSLNQR